MTATWRKGTLHLAAGYTVIGADGVPAASADGEFALEGGFVHFRTSHPSAATSPAAERAADAAAASTENGTGNGIGGGAGDGDIQIVSAPAVARIVYRETHRDSGGVVPAA